jgi:hypothetical protein
MICFGRIERKAWRRTGAKAKGNIAQEPVCCNQAGFPVSRTRSRRVVVAYAWLERAC